MLQRLKDWLAERELKLDPWLGLLGMAVLAALLALAVGFYLWRDNQAHRPLYGAGEAFPVAEVMQVLEAEGVPYRVHPQSGQILVPEGQLARARMLLAAKGVQVSLPAGYELFDKDEPLGTSQFVQNVRLKRSLEGELARTIMALKGVEQARVHIAQEETGSFVVARRAPAKASVMLQLAPGYRLKPEQVGAIVNLVANSVPQLKPEDVSVVDQYGTLLSRGIDGWGGPAHNWQVVDDYQRKVVANIEEVLAPVVGPGNFRVSVAANIDLSQREETLQTLGEEPRLRSEVLRSESSLDQLALGVPGSLSNLPVAAPQQAEGDEEGGAPTATAPTSVRNESTRQLDYDQRITHIRYPGFELRQQSIAVVLNAASAPEGGWSEEARAELEAAIRSAAGFNAERGDLLTLTVLPFAPVQIPVEEVRWWENQHVHSLLKLGLAGLLGLLLVLLVLRPAVRQLIASANGAAALPGVDEDRQALLSQEALPALTGSSSKTPFSESNPLAEISLPEPGSGLEKQIEHLQMLAMREPERVSEVIKRWIGRNERDLNPAG
ncbi:MAG: flagellar M-ring protein FliF [Xanthomonadaceae bacterium]|nr:flagellar M-ring protein FliF [Xanthomonadaceae bacterium]